jgi:hypothetical protein
MKTKDFIKMLQDADPSGEAYVRMSGGVPIFAELKEGYWDGPYSYIDEDGKYITSTEGTKVDIWTKEPNDYIWDDLEWNSYQEPEDGLFEKLKSKFEFRFGGYAIPAHRQERIDSFFKDLKEELDDYISYKKASDQKYLDEVCEKYKNGWKFLQKKEGKWKFYDWDILDENGKNQGANWATTGPILLSGKFEPTDSDKYLEWKLK